MLYYITAVIACLSFAFVPIVAQSLFKYFDEYSITYAIIAVKALPFIFLALFGSSGVDLWSAFSWKSVMISSIEVVRTLVLRLCYLLLPPSIAQALYFTFPFMVSFLNVVLGNIDLSMELLFGALISLFGSLVFILSGRNALSQVPKIKFGYSIIVGIMLVLSGAFLQALETVFIKNGNRMCMDNFEDLKEKDKKILDIVPKMYNLYTFAFLLTTGIFVLMYYMGYIRRFDINLNSLPLLMVSFVATIGYFFSNQGLSREVIGFYPYLIVVLTGVLSPNEDFGLWRVFASCLILLGAYIANK